MKSLLLEGLPDRDKAEECLSRKLPGQTDPWLLRVGDPRDPMAYLVVIEGDTDGIEGPFAIQADISGRFYDDHEAAWRLMNELQVELGGFVTEDE